MYEWGLCASRNSVRSWELGSFPAIELLLRATRNPLQKGRNTKMRWKRKHAFWHWQLVVGRAFRNRDRKLHGSASASKFHRFIRLFMYICMHLYLYHILENDFVKKRRPMLEKWRIWWQVWEPTFLHSVCVKIWKGYTNWSVAIWILILLRCSVMLSCTYGDFIWFPCMCDRFVCTFDPSLRTSMFLWPWQTNASEVSRIPDWQIF